MKLLALLNILQLAVVSLLLVKVFSIEANQVSSPIYTPVESPLYTLEETPVAAHEHQEAQSSIYQYETVLRDIIREEVSLLLQQSALSAQPDSSIAQQANDSELPQQSQEYLEQVQSDLDYYLADGQISEKDMAQFQMKVARLDQRNRKEMLRKLVRVLNSGELKGRL